MPEPGFKPTLTGATVLSCPYLRKCQEVIFSRLVILLGVEWMPGDLGEWYVNSTAPGVDGLGPNLDSPSLWLNYLAQITYLLWASISSFIR